MKLLTAAALVLLTSSASAEQLDCQGVDTFDGKLIEFKTFINEEYFTIDDNVVLEFYSKTDDDIVRLYGIPNYTESEYYGTFYNTQSLEFILISMPLQDLFVNYYERMITYGFGNCEIDDAF
jgi:hypothetical protein